MKISIYEQDCWGKVHWRVMRDDGQQIMDCHQIDFDTEEDAVDSVFAWARRNKLSVQVRVRYRSSPVRVIAG